MMPPAARHPGSRTAPAAARRPGLRRLGTPRPATVRADARGLPLAVGRSAVEAVAEEWVVEDRWWTARPLRRRYFELVLADGRNAVVFRELDAGRWYSQPGG